MKTLVSSSLAAALMLSTAATAQTYGSGYAQQTQSYQDRVADYRQNQADYQARRDEYERQRAQYMRDQADYDRRYGSGAYVRRYGAWRDYDAWSATNYSSNASYEERRAEYDRARADYERARSEYDRRYGYGSYSRRYGDFRDYDAWSADRYGRDVAYTNPYSSSPCEQQARNNQTAGGVIGALAGAAIGSNVAARNARTEGAVLGAIVGAAAGASIGKSTAKCDDRGYYFSYNDTMPYRESDWDRRASSGAHDYRWYTRNNCRLATAPAYRDGSTDYRYVRVCPDANGRYRITG